jgi:type II secretory pathway pseudopilin PulG
MIPFNTKSVSATHGFMLIEVALVILLLAVILGPVLHLVANQNQKDKLLAHLQTRQNIIDAVEGFVLAHGRLPCPAQNINGIEQRLADACMNREGWLPSASLDVLSVQGQWRMAVATLEQAGEPAQNSLVSSQPFSDISPQQLAEIVLAPYTASYPLGTGPLPAIHLCQEIAGVVPPVNTTAGCGGHHLLSPSAVWVAYLVNDRNQNRYQQFFITPDQPAINPVWLSFERLNWLWMKRGSLDSITTSTTTLEN